MVVRQRAQQVIDFVLKFGDRAQLDRTQRVDFVADIMGARVLRIF